MGVKPSILLPEMQPPPKPDNVTRALALGEELIGLLKMYGPVVAAKLSQKQRGTDKQASQETLIWKEQP